MSGRFSHQAAPIMFYQPDGSITDAPSSVPVLEVLLPARIHTLPDGQREIDLNGQGWRRQFALVDTGAMYCTIDPNLAAILRLDPVANINVHGATGSGVAGVYEHPLFIAGSRTLVECHLIASDQLSNRPIAFILGMDVLRQGRLVMDFQRNEFLFHPWVPD